MIDGEWTDEIAKVPFLLDHGFVGIFYFVFHTFTLRYKILGMIPCCGTYM